MLYAPSSNQRRDDDNTGVSETYGGEDPVTAARYGFCGVKLEGGVLTPDVEILTIRALRQAFGDAETRRSKLDANIAEMVSDRRNRECAV